MNALALGYFGGVCALMAAHLAIGGAHVGGALMAGLGIIAGLAGVHAERSEDGR